MKRAKMVLTAIAVCTIVGGALAVKADRFDEVIFCGNAKNNCPNFVAGKQIVATTTTATAPFCGTELNVCPQRVITAINP